MRITITENPARDRRVRYTCTIDEGAGFEGRGETKAAALYQAAFSMRRQEIQDEQIRAALRGEE